MKLDPGRDDGWPTRRKRDLVTISMPADRLVGPQGLVIDTRARRAYVADHEVQLTQQGFDLLAYLLRERGRVVPNDELIRAVWGHSVVVGSHFVQTAVYRLRAALRAAGIDELIDAVRGVGYRIESEEATPSKRARRLRDDAGLKAALRVSALPSIVIDGQQRILFANDAMARLTGYSIEELEALPSAEALSPPAVRERRETDLAALMSGTSDGGWSEPVVRCDGSIVNLEMFAEPIEIDGEVSGVLVQLWLKRGELAAIEPPRRPEPREVPSDRNGANGSS
jgi:PAS domain S-box-containing protein